jgi:succinate dehydrogenase/fumarate reductase flavoprotein subunit
MFDHNKFPYRLVLNSKAVKGIAWHCHHYCGRGVMKVFESGTDLCKEMGIEASDLQATFDDYNKCSADPSKDPWDTKFFPAGQLDVNDKFNVAIVRPVNHYTMGGVGIDTKSRVLAEAGGIIPGLFSGGEATGGVHGNNRLGGSGLLECVVFGRLAGASCVEYLKSLPAPSSGAAVTISIPQSNGTTITVTITGDGVTGLPSAPSAASAAAAPAAEEPKAAAAAQGEYTLEEVAKHNTEEDCWVVVGEQVLDVTKFLPDHPGGAMAIVTFAGKDATEMFEMVHEEGVIEKFAPECVIGKLKASSKM